MTKLWGYIEGRRDIFGISISRDDTIDDLKKRIYDEHIVQLRVQYSHLDLTLMKVRYIMISM